MKSIGLIFLVLITTVVLALPVMAASTFVTISSGGPGSPVIECKWEQDLSASLEDGDPTHISAGSQFLPPLTYQGKKTIQYWAIVTDLSGVGSVNGVYAGVFHPVGPPGNGTKVYEIPLQKTSLSAGRAAYIAARNAGLVLYQSNTLPPLSDQDILNELDKGVAEVYTASADLNYCQPAGDYKVVYDAFNSNNAWASQATPPVSLENTFGYMPVCGIEVDFNAVDYGSVSLGRKKLVPGDTVWDPMLPPPALSPNQATVRNVGNTPAFITVSQNDMGLGFAGMPPATAYSGSAPPSAVQSNWNVVSGARMGNDDANAMYSDPNVKVTLPNKLELCSQNELDFYIIVKKSSSGSKTGTMSIGCVIAPFSP